MNKLQRLVRDDVEMFLFWCPGCECGHAFTTKGRPVWKFDGNMEEPTFSPSLKYINPKTRKVRCHLFVRKGQIEFLKDCKHELAGKTVPLEAFP